MKKFIGLFIVLFSFIGVYSVDAYTDVVFDIDWYNVYIEVPLNANIKEYEEKFVVNVYLDNVKLVKDVDYFVKLGINGTSIDTVTTNKTGRYEVDARVWLKEYSASSENTITFHVIDYNSPGYGDDESYITASYGEKPDYAAWFKARNSSTTYKTVSVDDQFVLINYVGEYYVTITAVDSNNISTTTRISVYVVDRFPPQITLINLLEISLGEEIDVTKYFRGYDAYDKEITNRIKVENYDETRLGTQQIYVSLTDVAGNTTRVQFTLTINDDSDPIIYFNTNDAKIDIENDITYEIFKGFIKSVEDDGTILNIDDVKIDFSSVLSELGSYTVLYYATDSEGNTGEYRLTVRVVQMRGPEITCKEVVIKSGEVFDANLITNYITVYDKYDSTAVNTLKVDLSSVNLSQKGTYMVLVSACNSSGIFTYDTLMITVEGKSFLDIKVYWPLLLLVIAPFGYYGYQYYQKQQAKKYEDNIL